MNIFDEYEAIHALLQQDPAQGERLLAAAPLLAITKQSGVFIRRRGVVFRIGTTKLEPLSCKRNAFGWTI